MSEENVERSTRSRQEAAGTADQHDNPDPQVVEAEAAIVVADTTAGPASEGRTKPVDTEAMGQLPEEVDLVDDHFLDVRRPVIAGYLVLAIAFGGFGAWAALAPLTSAAIAPGTVHVSGERQSVQHLEGGIIKAILVAEGSRVERGDTLIRLDDTQPRAALAALNGRQVSLLATAARLRAERDGADEITYPDDLLERRADPAVADVISGENGVFESRKAALSGQIDVMKQRNQRFEDEIDALNAQRVSTVEQLALFNEELEAATVIYEKGIFEKPRYLALKRAVAGLEGKIGEQDALIARTRQKISETDLEIIDLQNRWLSEVTGKLQVVTAESIDLQERIMAAQDVIRRIEIKAPDSGAVVGLKFHTVGGVIPPGAQILDIVPDAATLVIEASVNPADIDVVGPGLDCEVQLSAYSARSTPRIAGKVKQVSADSFVDEHSGVTYYRALIEVDPGSLAKLEGVELYPGMPAEVFIKTGERTALDYLIEPLQLALRRASSQ